MNKTILFSIAGALALFGGPLIGAAPAYAQQAAPPAPVQQAAPPTCEQLAAESMALTGRMVGMIRELTQAAGPGVDAARVQVIVSTIASALPIPVVGGIMEQVSSAATTPVMAASGREMAAVAERMAVDGDQLATRLQEVQAIRAERCGLQVEPDAGDE